MTIVKLKQKPDLMSEMGYAACRILDLQSEYACIVWVASLVVFAATIATACLQLDVVTARGKGIEGVVTRSVVVPFHRS